MRSHIPLRFLACTLAGSICATDDTSAQVSFTRLVDNQTQMPGAPQGRTFLNMYASGISGNRIVMYGEGLTPQGVYEWNSGSLSRIADTTTPVPQSTGSFLSLGSGPNSGEHVLFGGRGSATGGLYNRLNGQLGRVFDETMTAPNGGKFLGAFSYGIDGTSIAFFAGHSSGASSLPSVYRWDNGTITTVADTTTAVPGGTGNFSDLQNTSVRIDQGAAMFIGLDANNKRGIYRRPSGGALSAVVDINTDGPSGMGKFASVVDFDSTGDDLILRGSTQTGGGGLYTRHNSTWSKLATTGDAAPGGGTFQLMQSLTLQSGVSVFHSAPFGTEYAIYSDYSGTLQRIIGPGDTLDGKTVFSAALGGRDGNNLAVTITFTDHTPPTSFDQAIYKVTLPAPPSAFIPFVGAAFLAARRSR